MAAHSQREDPPLRLGVGDPVPDLEHREDPVGDRHGRRPCPPRVGRRRRAAALEQLGKVRLQPGSVRKVKERPKTMDFEAFFLTMT